ncbi:MAG: CarD family transcriptional regulator [Firmicutes bacterium]|jgi:CarD family transcriptional regulator|nr:CarD family transcriptional regulator [Bacillota bacterium]MBR0416789.1 CarD family transcriptional regulator [Bacillota bacterium]MBR0482188.1 CarD family transcriptional regulator [Bacillota bacterium]
MFKVGDSVVYPMHGAGVIESIEDRQVLGETRSYYIIRISRGKMQVMVPVDGSDKVGLRAIVKPDELNEVYEVLKAESTPMDDNWNRRNRENMDKLKTGNLPLVAEVIRNLVRVDRVKKLSTGEKKMLSNSKLILASEMEVSLGISEEEALTKIEKLI